MVSDRKRAANATNAQRSTGPRTPDGKRRSGQNARKHGLSAPVGSDPAYSGDIEAITRLILGDTQDEAMVSLARQVAEQTADLARIAAVRTMFIHSAYLDQAEWAEHHPHSDLSRPLADTAEALLSLDRYDRRCLSRRKATLLDLLERMRG